MRDCFNKGIKLKKLTTADFIRKAILVHGITYDYSLVDYQRAFEQVSIICKKHGTEFSQIANNHLRGYGCPECGKAKIGVALKGNTLDFVNKAVKVHGDKYDYSEVVYTKTHSKVKIICPKHGEFAQEPANHLAGKGCTGCKADVTSEGFSDTQEDFVRKASEAHDFKYDYSAVKYVNSGVKVDIICKEHGVFKQQPTRHVFGNGCPSCAKTGFDPLKGGYLYILSCGDTTKIGITNLSPKERARKVSKSFGAEFEVRDSWSLDDGQKVQTTETLLLRELRAEYDRPTTKFEGSSECFLNVDYDKLVARIEEELA